MARRTRASTALAVPARKALKQLGNDLKTARRSRRLGVRDAAERMMVSPATLQSLERGEPGVGIGVLASALWVMGLSQRLGQLVSPGEDLVGAAEAQRQLPKRIRKRKADDDYDF